MSQYQHTPLVGPREIRVLYLKPGLSYRQLRCTVKNISLDDPKNAVYSALSYVCGTEPSDCKIVCNGKEWYITPNCEAALRRFRHQTHERILWVDSICINPLDNAERSSQIKLMTDIYASAQEVFLWLGEGNIKSDALLPHLARIAELDRAYRRVSSSSSDGGDDEEDRPDLRLGELARLKVTNDALSDEIRVPILANLFQRPWFQRVWTMQELILAKKPVIVCGKHSMSWEDFREAVEVIKSADYDLYGHDSARVVNVIVHFRDIIERDQQTLPRLQGMQGSDFDMLNQMWQMLIPNRDNQFYRSLRSLCLRKSTEVPDRIFALYGLFSKLEVTLPDPDYSKPISDIFREASITIITQKKSLMLLILGVGAHEIQGLPSWAVDWSFSAPGINPDIFPKTDNWRPTSGWSTSFRFSDNGKKLHVSAKIIDVVNLRSRGLPSVEYSSIIDTIYSIRVFGSWIIAALTTDTGTKNRAEVFWKVIQDHSGGLLMMATGEKYNEAIMLQWIDFVIGTAGCHSEALETVDLTSLKRNLRDSWPAIVDPNDNFHKFPTEFEMKRMTHLAHHDEISHFHIQRRQILRGTVFFTTQQGRMGRCQSLPERGDVVVLISGVNFPMLLRRKNDGYIVLGTAFVTGVMEGEACPKTVDEWDEITLI